MPEQFENSEATKLEDETVSDATLLRKGLNASLTKLRKIHEN